MTNLAGVVTGSGGRNTDTPFENGIFEFREAKPLKAPSARGLIEPKGTVMLNSRSQNTPRSVLARTGRAGARRGGTAHVAGIECFAVVRLAGLARLDPGHRGPRGRSHPLQRSCAVRNAAGKEGPKDVVLSRKLAGSSDRA
jgi:hypothetical protein